MASRSTERVSAEGANYGDMELDMSNERVVLKSATNGYRILDCQLDRMALCVIPASNRDEIEIHFHDNDKAERDESSLAQLTLHFPASEDPDEEETAAEMFRKAIMGTNIIKSAVGDAIVTFSKEQGNFVSPRGKYEIKMMPTFMHMQGAQYSYNISYEDISSLFLLPKPDGNRQAFVISLEKPIRQGTQKYSHLIWESHKIETTIDVNLSNEEIISKYGEGQLESPTMTMPMSSLIAKVFKVLTQTVVFVPKQFSSFRGQSSVRCNLRANEGLLYPLAKSLIFINKPTVLVKFDDIESIEFLRYDAQANSATRNFDVQVTLKPDAKSESREYTFSAIDRSEFNSMSDFFKSRGLNVIVPEGATRMLDIGDDDESDDESYTGAASDDSSVASGSGSGSDDDDSGSESGGGSGDEDRDRGKSGKGEGKGKKRTKSSASAGASGKKGKKGGDSEKPKKKRQKKDKDAPKGAKSAYIIFGAAVRSKILEENPGMKQTEVLKEVGNRWKTLSKEEKSIYEDEARLDKERYNQEMVKYKASKQAAGDSSP